MSTNLTKIFLFTALPIFIAGITTTHYDKAPDLTQQHSSSIKPINQRQPANLTLAERQKRLLPYINFYVSDNTKTTGDDVFYATPQKINSYQQVDASKFGELLSSPYDQNKVYDPQVSYEPKIKYTPFLESNALPGPFVPMIRQQPHKIKIYHNPLEQRDKVPNYSAIYDKLSQLKLQQNAAHNYYKNLQNNGPRYYLNRKPQVNYIPLRDYQEQIQPPKMYVHSYTPTSIEVPSSEDNSYETQTYNGPERIPIKFAHHTIKPHPYRVIQLSNSKDVHEQLLTNETPLKLTTTNNYVPTLAEYIIQQPKPYHTQNHKQFLQEVIPNRKPFLLVSQKPTTNEQFKVTKPIIVLPPPKSYTSEPIVSPNYQTISAIQVPTPPTTGREEDSNSLGQLLKKLQDSNTLPHTLTPDNIDNSIKTLVQILNSLKKHQKITRPIVVAEESDEYQDEDEGDKGDESSLEDSDDGSVTHNFPANTPEGGTPGKPGIDYPALSSIPQTNFNCKTQRYKGFFADPDTNCQVIINCE